MKCLSLKKNVFFSFCFVCEVLYSVYISIFFSFLSAMPIVLLYQIEMNHDKHHFHNLGNVNMLHSFLWKSKRNYHRKHILI